MEKVPCVQIVKIWMETGMMNDGSCVVIDQSSIRLLNRDQRCNVELMEQ